MRVKRLIPFLLAALPVGVSAACFGPTQMRVEVLTDLGCQQEPRSAIYVMGDDAPAGETGDDSCRESTPMSVLGDIVFTPGSRDDRSSRVTVRVKLAYGRDAAGNRRQPSDCDRDPSVCIFASRTFTYVEHEGRRAPVRLYRDCLGKLCDSGQTCIQGGSCVADAVVCAGDSCSVPGEAPLSTGPVSAPDAAAPDDAGVDADAGRPACALPPQGGDVLVDANVIPTKATASSTAFFWVEPSASPASFMIRKLSRGSATPANALPTPIPGVVEALAALGDELWFVYRQDGGGHVLAANGVPVSLTQWAEVTDMVLAPVPGGARRAYMSVPSQGKVVYYAAGDGPFELLVTGAGHVTFDAQKAYARAVSGVNAYDLTAPKSSLPPHETQYTWNALGTNGTAAFGTINATSGAGIEVRSISPNPAFLGKTRFAPVGKLSADATHVYWIEDVNDDWQLRRLRHTPLPMDQPDAEVVRRFGAVETADLHADPAAVGCLYYWQGTSLRVAQKVPAP